jgi:hypothetical protein
VLKPCEDCSCKDCVDPEPDAGEEQDASVPRADAADTGATADAALPEGGPCDRAGSVQTSACGAGKSQFRVCESAQFTGWSACAAPGFRDMAAAPSELVGRAFHASIWTGTEMLVWGGTNGEGAPLENGAAYNPRTDTWRMLPAAPLAARSHMTSVWNGELWMIYGGHLAKQAGVALLPLATDGAVYNPKTNTWKKMVDLQLGPRERVSAVWEPQRKKFILWGGLPSTSLGAQTGLSTGRFFVPALNASSDMPPLNSSVGTGRAATAFYDDQKMHVFGGDGCAGLPCKDAIVFDTFNQRWEKFAPVLPGNLKDGKLFDWSVTPRPAGGIVIYGGRVAGKAVHEGYVYNAGSKMFSRLPDVPALVAEVAEKRTTFFCGSRFGFFGGLAALDFTSSGALLKDDGLGWEPLPTSSPSPRLGATSASFGNEVMLWGGRHDGTNGAFFEHYNNGKILRLP